MERAFEQTLEDIDRRCQASNVPYAIIGGVAAIIHGSTRTTVDIDITVTAEIENLDSIPKLFSDTYSSLIANPIDFITKHFFVPLQHKDTQVQVDIAAALSGFERRVISRSHRSFFNDVEVNVSSVEDLILMKLVASRAQDIVDVEKLVLQNKKNLDVQYLRTCAKEFIEVERSDVVKQLEKVLESR